MTDDQDKDLAEWVRNRAKAVSSAHAKRDEQPSNIGSTSAQHGPTSGQPVSHDSTKTDNKPNPDTNTQDNNTQTNQTNTQDTTQTSTQDNSQSTTQTNTQTPGDVPATDSANALDSEESSRTRGEIDIGAVYKRLESEGRWRGQIELQRNEMMKEAKKSIPDKHERQQWVYGELDRMYPPVNKPDIVLLDKDVRNSPDGDATSSPKADDGQIQGLGAIPDHWPELPANASLAAEVGWVQANRLRCVDEQPGHATKVDLGEALSPAPSWSALGWLETSIRSYAKFVDVAAKATANADDESEVLRMERRSVDEMQALLDEMIEG